MKIFIDTNILIYYSQDNSEMRNFSKIKIKEFIKSNDKLYISTQVIKEYLKNLTVIKQIPINKIFENLNFFLNITTNLYDDSGVLQNLLNLILEYNVKGKAVFDCNIVATMISNNIDSILKHNIKDFKKYEKLINIIPLI